MKQYLPYNVLVAIALAVLGFTLFYNLTLRESFAVTVGYTMPAAPRPVEDVIIVEPDYEDEEYRYEEWDYAQDYGGGESQLVSVTFPLELNRATEAELRFIPRVGAITASRIVQYRDVLGGYTSLDQLKEIKGIGGDTFENIARYLYVEGEGEYDGAKTATDASTGDETGGE